MLSSEQIRLAPKVVLHDHLDGGLRPQTILDLARENNYTALPFSDEAQLANWFHTAVQGSLNIYLETFAHTVGVMQTPAALERVAKECALDHAASGVVYAEIRFAPELHTAQGLSMAQVVDHVLAGFAEGEKQSGNKIVMRALLTAMRTSTHADEVAQLVVAYRDKGVVGFDIAGKEEGFPPTEHLSAFEYLKRENAHFTIHAGEAFGLPSIWEAIQLCGAQRLGHGVRIMDDITINPDGTVTLGQLAHYIRDCRIPLELCPKSNVDTHAAPSIAEHPIKLLADLGFRVTVNTDNRLMSNTSMIYEMTELVTAHNWGLAELQWLTINAMKSAFIHHDERLELINKVIKPGYAALASR
jgi:adenosine deaminase